MELVKLLLFAFLGILTFSRFSLGFECSNNHHTIRAMPNLAKKLKLIQLDCGQVCDTNIQPIRKEKYYDYIEKNVDCLTLFESPILEHTAMEENIDEQESYKPPSWCELPQHLRKLFSYNGRINVRFFTNNPTKFCCYELEKMANLLTTLILARFLGHF